MRRSGDQSPKKPIIFRCCDSVIDMRNACCVLAVCPLYCICNEFVLRCILPCLLVILPHGFHRQTAVFLCTFWTQRRKNLQPSVQIVSTRRHLGATIWDSKRQIQSRRSYCSKDTDMPLRGPSPWLRPWQVQFESLCGWESRSCGQVEGRPMYAGDPSVAMALAQLQSNSISHQANNKKQSKSWQLCIWYVLR